MTDFFAKQPVKHMTELLIETVELAADEVFWMDMDSTIVFVNKSTCDKLGYAREQLIGMQVQDWDPDVTPEEWVKIVEVLKRDKALNIVRIHKTSEDKLVPVRIKAHLVDVEDEQYIICFVNEITD